MSALDIAELLAFCLAMQSFMAFLLVILSRAVCCWCGVEAAEGSAPLFAGASAASLDVAARWWGLDAELGAVLLPCGAVCATATLAAMMDNNVSTEVVRYVLMLLSSYVPGARILWPLTVASQWAYGVNSCGMTPT